MIFYWLFKYIFIECLLCGEHYARCYEAEWDTVSSFKKFTKKELENIRKMGKTHSPQM